MRIVVALGGNALLRRGDTPDASTQIEHVRHAAEQLAKLAQEHDLIVTHGNGPQVGVLALESAKDESLSQPYPFDTLGAETQGMIGYWLLQALQNELPGREVAALINQTLVDADDPAFANPTKFIGEVYSKDEALALAEERGWTVKPDGEYYRRVVGSPLPVQVVETATIRRLVNDGAVVVCAGGGGIPVIDDGGRISGVEAVIDKDRTASVLAQALGADVLMILTDVDGVYENYGTPQARALTEATPELLRTMGLPAGSMGPKVDAACQFVEATGGTAVIGRLEDAIENLNGNAGTRVVA
ncbi:carbamate kinase [Arcanobacterium canis]|uniref:Carbamate kinase n=1 Tax=Arcanobacterium canis TaxID=999183 RepID=A0ABY8FYP4_9ACTO|nr:carbamate kinase [Arcanobacterium canis]WFM83568.1 carbamate kinase [Arcanobacterium canis]